MANTAPVPNIRPAMNPGMCVAGGGGNAGGGGPGSGGAGSGSEGAGTGKGNQNPADGSKSGADCGAGGNGGCTGCSSQIAKGDPVDVATGEVFTLPVTDLKLPGYFDFELIRSYSSRDRNLDRGMGFGWAHSLDWEIQRDGDRLYVTSGEGHREDFIAPELGQSTGDGPWVVTTTKDGYVLRAGNEFLHYFVADEADKERFRLTRVKHPSRGELGLFYEQGQLVNVVDSVGRTINLARDRKGRLISIDVPPPEGKTRIFARFRYDEEDNLVEVMDADHHSTTYAYDAEHRLIQYRYATGLTFHFRYDREGRCIETWGDYPGGNDPALSPEAPEYLADNETRAKGIYHVKLDFGPDGYREVIDSVRVQRFFTNELGLVDKGVDAYGNVTERVYDDSGRVTGMTDRIGATTTYAYDDHGNVILERDAEGHTYRFEYDQDDHLTKITDPAGNSLKEVYTSAGELEYLEDLRGGIIFNHLGERGLVLGQVTQNGGRTDYQYDAHANCVWRRDPNGSEWRYSFDWWGNQLEEHSPTGLVTQFQYADSGRLVLTEDSLGNQERWEYDGMGNCTAQQTPDRLWTRYVYGGFRWLCITAHPDGTSFETKYTREGWAVEYKNERGEPYQVAHDPNALPDKEVTYDGRTMRAGYDAMSRLHWLEEGAIRTDYERSAMGLLLAKTTKEGEQRFEYNECGKMVAATNGPVGFRWQRDAGGALVSEALTIGDAKYQLTYGVDKAGQCIALKDADGDNLEYTRDASGRVTCISSKGHPILAIERNIEGTSQRLALPGHAFIVDEFDPLERLKRRELVTRLDERYLQGPEWIGKSNQGTFRAYHWDAMDQLVEETSAETTTTYEYDSRQFLRAKRVGGSRGTAGTEVFRPDEMGRPYESREDGGPGRSYGPGGLLERRGNVSYTYDARHRMTTKRERLDDGAERVWQYEWDDWEMLTAVVTPRGLRAEYAYDAFARRMQKRVLRLETEGEDAGTYKLLWRTDYLWAKCSLLQEIDFDADGTRARTRSYLYEEVGDVIALGHRDNDGEWRYYFSDHKGTPEAIVDASGRVLGRLAYSAYGRAQLLAGSTESTQLRFPGQYEDPETGLHYNRFRYYDPDTGRYLSPDPIGYDGGHDLFGYGPNPIGYSDPMGWRERRKGKSRGRGRNSNGGIRSGTSNDTPPELQSDVVCPRHRNPPRAEPFEAAEREADVPHPACPNCQKASRPSGRKRKKKGASYPAGSKPNKLPKKKTSNRAARECGMDPKHAEKLAERTKENKELIIVRASNPASLKYHDDPNAIAKPKSEKRKTAKSGPHDGLVVDDNGKPVLIDGKKVHGDYDLQTVRKKKPDGSYEQVDTNDQDFIDGMNRTVTPNKPMFQHGANDDYIEKDKVTKETVTDPRTGKDKMGRDPDPDEKFLISEPDGTQRVANSTQELKNYYKANNMPWPYAVPPY